MVNEPLLEWPRLRGGATLKAPLTWRGATPVTAQRMPNRLCPAAEEPTTAVADTAIPLRRRRAGREATTPCGERTAPCRGRHRVIETARYEMLAHHDDERRRVAEACPDRGTRDLKKSCLFPALGTAMARSRLRSACEGAEEPPLL